MATLGTSARRGPQATTRARRGRRWSVSAFVWFRAAQERLVSQFGLAKKA